MKKLIILFAALTLSSAAFAQDDNMDNMDKKKMEKKDSKSNQTDHKKDHIMMKDGKMMMVKNEKEMDMDKDMTLSNGTIVMMDGTMKTKDGKTMKMKNGDMIDMKGKMGKMEMDKKYERNVMPMFVLKDEIALEQIHW